MTKKVLIIKLGFCETLVQESGRTVSLGEVFRHTVLLHLYKDCHVVWLTGQEAFPLLQGNKFIKELYVFNFQSAQKEILNQSFDEVICLENDHEVNSFASQVRTIKLIDLGASTSHLQMEINQYFQESLFHLLGKQWNFEEYVLDYQASSFEKYDIGLNYMVGTKWPSKAWPLSYWKEFKHLCEKEGLVVSWQKGMDNLYDYMNWIFGGKTIITSDSLGMHIALAMKKSVVAVFGPTSPDEIYMYNRGISLRGIRACAGEPCWQAQCQHKVNCMKMISPSEVFLNMKLLDTTGRGLEQQFIG